MPSFTSLIIIINIIIVIVIITIIRVLSKGKSTKAAVLLAIE